MRMDTLGAVSMLSFLKTNSPSVKSRIVFHEDIAHNEESATIKTYVAETTRPQNKKNTSPNYSQPALKNLSCTDKPRQSHKSLKERTLVTIQNNNVESLPSIYFTRPTCGNTYTTKAPKRCGISMTNGTKIVNLSN